MPDTRPTDAGARTAVDATADDSLFSNDSLLALLVAIRASSIPKDRKMELRDLVLEFAQSHDGALRTQLRDVLKEYKKELAPALLKPMGGAPSRTDVRREAALHAGIGRPRPVPVFSYATAPQSPSPEPSKPEAVRAPEKEQTVPVEEEVVREPEPKPVPNSEEVSAPLAATAEEAKARILAIKRLVNDRVGNPVNLIEKDRAIGQEYMSALLDAMKQSSGAGGRVGAAMERLERALAAIETLLGDASMSTPTPKASTQTEVKLNVVSDAPAPMPHEEEVVMQRVELEPTPVAPEPVVEEVPPLPPPPRPEPIPVPPAAPQQPMETELPVPPSAPPVESSRRIAPPVPPRPPSSSAQLGAVPMQDIRTNTAPPPPPRTPAAAPVPPPVAHQVRVARPVDARPDARADVRTPVASQGFREEERDVQEQVLQPLPRVATNTRMSSPYSPEHTPVPPQVGGARDAQVSDEKVEDGLHQMLSEWKLFKSSGIFGTGPHGIEHPLYKQLAQLPLAAVIAGRFEGATPEIRQTIADYMNGWRYEHGIVHKMEEHFEDYLRRVVATILKNQKSSR